MSRPSPAASRSSWRRCLALAAVVPALALLAACGSNGDTSSSASPAGAAAPTDGSCVYSPGGAPATKKAELPPGEPATTEPISVTISTNNGDVKATLDGDKTPCTVNSFVSLAKQGYFDDTPCHRLTTEGIYVLQCGDPSGQGSGGPGYSFEDELISGDSRLTACKGADVCTYPAGTLAMANAGPNTNGSQFFLVYADSALQPFYSVFGRMDASGLKTVKTIAEAGAEGGALDGKPVTATSITGVTIK